MAAPRGANHNDIVRKINATLQGPVIDTLAELLPDIRRLPRRTALETVLDDVDLLNRCFLAFRANPDRFRHILVNKHKVSVEDAEALLECGRSLDDVVAMVVRTAAKRHFRRGLDGSSKALRTKPRRKPKRDLMSRLMAMLSTPEPIVARPKTRGELLYDVFKDYLLHDWQVPMIPEYCLLSPGTVRRLGARILDYRIAEDIRRLRADPDNPPPPTPLVEDDQKTKAGYRLPAFLTAPKDGAPAAITGTAEKRVSDGMATIDYGNADRTARDERARIDDILTSDGKRLKANAFTIVLLDPQVRAVLPHSEQTVRISDILGSVNGMAGKMLVNDLGLRVDQLAVFIMSAHAALGEKRFQTAFGVPGRPDYMARIIERAKAFKISQTSTLPAIAAFVSKSFKVDNDKKQGV
ncbi:MAG: hypothetical protein H7Y60_18190 [Rhodospirillaceae bacterium]|nr:hypothetical protein [Rhodospirillales bacterium]